VKLTLFKNRFFPLKDKVRGKKIISLHRNRKSLRETYSYTPDLVDIKDIDHQKSYVLKTE